MTYYNEEKVRVWWNPATWTRRIWLIVGTVVVLAVVAIVGAVVGVKATQGFGDGSSDAYPDYYPINYTLVDTYSGTTFFDKFIYFRDVDPTGGHVHYVDPEYAGWFNLTYATETTAIIKVDTTVGPGDEPDASTGRFTVRLESKTQYGPGLFLFDVKHTPHGCATWPALWLTDPHNWPAHGEIDIMEAVNQAVSGNLMALHTAEGCTMENVRRQLTGTPGQADCHNATNHNTGCTVTGPPSTYGADFNAGGGGIVALEWRTEGIRVWVFRRDDAAAAVKAMPGIGSPVPDPSTWGLPLADFPATRCDVDRHFRNQSIVVNIDLCGVLVESVWEESGCSPKSCENFVTEEPEMFKDAYWEFGSFQVWQAKK